MLSASSLMLVVTLCMPGLGNGFFGTKAKPGCRVQTCSNAHNKRVGENEEQRRICVSLAMFKVCVSSVRLGCRGDLNFHTTFTLVPRLMKQWKCGNVTAPKNESDFHSRFSTKPEPTEPIAMCEFHEGEFTKSRVSRHCGLFGDPHLRTFNEEKQTCVVKGAWPLIRNQFLTVMVSNVELVPGSRTSQSVTATNKIVVILREQKKSCIEQKIYRAETDSVPAVFLDGSWETGPASCPVKIVELTRGSLIHINLCYIRTKIVIRQVGKYLTFHMRIPEDIVTSSSQGLCVAGCPSRERIDYKEVLSFTEAQLKARHSKLSRREATDLCTASGVQGFYLDSCVFDLMLTGDMNFTAAAKSALEDAFTLDPERTVQDLKDYNSTVLLNTRPRTIVSHGKKSSANGLQRSFLLTLVIPFVILFHSIAR